MSHTPGPWALDERTLYVFQLDGGGPIAACGDPYPRGDNHPLENMRLIAAAPDLLRELSHTALTAHLLVCCEDPRNYVAFRDCQNDRCVGALAALDKAAGPQSYWQLG